MTEAEKAAREARMAKLLQQMESFFDENGDLKKFDDRVKQVELLLKIGEEDDAKGVDLMDRQAIEDEFEKLRAQNERIMTSISHSKRGAWFPGIEDESKNFNLLKAMVAVKKGSWKDASHEEELIKASIEALVAKGQSAGDLEAGGAFVPDQLIPDVIGPIYTKSAFLAMDGDGQTRVTILDGLPGGRVTIPQFHGGMIAYWMGEEDPYTEVTSKTGDVHMDLKKIGVLARITDTMIKFGSYGFNDLLRADMIKALVKKIDWTIPFGTGGDNMPRGIAHWNSGGHRVAETDTAGNAVGPGVKVFRADTNVSMTYDAAQTLGDGSGFVGGEIDFDSLSLMRLMFEEDDVDVSSSSFATIAAPRYWDRLRRIKVENYTGQTTGQPYLIGIPILTESRLADLVGPMGKMNQLATNSPPGAAGNNVVPVFGGASATAKFSGLFMGDFSQVIFGRGSGIEIEDDAGKGTGFTTDSTYLKVRMYADQLIRDPRAVGFTPDVQVRD